MPPEPVSLAIKEKSAPPIESADTSPPAIEITRKKSNLNVRGCAWERDLFNIVLDRVKLLYEKYGLTDALRMQQAAREIYWSAKIVVKGYPDSFLRHEGSSEKTGDQMASTLNDCLSLHLIPEEAKSLVCDLLRSHQCMLMDFKARADADAAALERELAKKIVCFAREINGKKFVLGKGIVQLDEPDDCKSDKLEAPQFKNIVLDAMRDQRRAELSNPGNRALKVTQANVAKRLKMPRTTFETKLSDPDHPLEWRRLKDQIDEEFRQKS